MKNKRIITITFLITFIVVCTVLLKLSLTLRGSLAEAASFESVIESFSSLQKKLATINILSYFLLMGISLWAFAVFKKFNYLLLSLILYSGVTLYNSVNLNKTLFALKGLDPLEESGYWLMVFMGVFYIIGAVAIGAIGYIAIKNYSQRSNRINK